MATISDIRAKYATVLDDTAGWKHSEEWAKDFDEALTEHDRELIQKTLKWAQRAFAGEDTIEWCRRAKNSSINLPWAMGLFDDLIEEVGDEEFDPRDWDMMEDTREDH